MSPMIDIEQMRPMVGSYKMTHSGEMVVSCRGEGRTQAYKGTHPKYRLTRQQYERIDRQIWVAFASKAPVTTTLINMGLDYDVTEAAPTVLQYQTQIGKPLKVDDPIVTSEEIAAGKLSGPSYRLDVTPLPRIVAKVGIDPHRPERIDEAAEAVGAEVEALLLGADPHTDELGRCYGLRNHPNRLTYSPGQEVPVRVVPGATDELVTIARRMSLLIYDRLGTGPFLLLHSDKEPDWPRVRVLPHVETLPTSSLPPGEVVMVQPTRDVLRIVVSVYPQLVWDGADYLVGAVVAPNLRPDHKGNLLVAHYRRS